MNNETIERYGAVFTLDTNVIKRACEDTRFANHIRQRCMGAAASEIVINSQVVNELERRVGNMQIISPILKEKLGVKRIRYEVISEAERRGATRLERWHETLHRGDSDILAFAHSKGFVLVTCDKGLARAAVELGIKCINPDARKRSPGSPAR